MSEMQVTIEELGTTRRRLDVEVPSETVAAEMERAFGRVQRQAKIKGFRPGHVPRAVLEKYFGEQVRADVLSHLIEHSFSDAVSRSGLRPVGSPEIVPQNIESGRPLRYSATIDIWPDLEIGSYEGIPARRLRRAVGEEEVDRAVDHLRESLAELRPVEGRDEVREGDFAVVDYLASVGGKPLPQGKRENRLVEVGKETVPPEIDRALVGMKTTESRAVDVEFPKDHPDSQVAGRAVRFDVTVRGIREKVVPPANDDLAREHGECTTLAELRTLLRERIAESFRSESDAEMRGQIVDEILRRNTFEVPRSLVERQAEALERDLMERLGPQAGALGEDRERMEKIREDLRERAEKQVRTVLALDAVGRKENVAISDDELNQRIETMAARLGQQQEKLRAAYADEGSREDLRQRMTRERVLDRIVESAKIEEVDAPPSDVAPAGEKG